MERRNFAQILEAANIDIKREYDRLYSSFYLQKIQDMYGNCYSLKEHCAMNIHFERVPCNFDLNYLILFCEYTYNLVLYLNCDMQLLYTGVNSPQQIYLQQIIKVIEIIGYMTVQKDGITIMVPKSQEAIAVSEIVSPTLSYKVIEYNHHALKQKNLLYFYWQTN